MKKRLVKGTSKELSVRVKKVKQLRNLQQDEKEDKLWARLWRRQPGGKRTQIGIGSKSHTTQRIHNNTGAKSGYL